MIVNFDMYFNFLRSFVMIATPPIKVIRHTPTIILPVLSQFSHILLITIILSICGSNMSLSALITIKFIQKSKSNGKQNTTHNKITQNTFIVIFFISKEKDFIFSSSNPPISSVYFAKIYEMI